MKIGETTEKLTWTSNYLDSCELAKIRQSKGSDRDDRIKYSDF
jgi:hypothetical protein